MTETFAALELDERLLKSLDKAGFKTPAPVQTEVIPAALLGRDILAQAPTGSGKTLAYLLPLMQRLLEQKGAKQSMNPRALVLVPTRELARQVFQMGVVCTAFIRLRLASLTGGESYGDQRKRLQPPPDLLIATPGRLQRALEQGDLDLDQTSLCVLDEADRMLDLGFGDSILALLAQLPEQRQLYCFSATLSEGGIDSFAADLMADPHAVNVGEARTLPPQVKQAAYLADSVAHKLDLLTDLLKDSGPSLVFTYSRERAEWLAGQLAERKLLTGCLHGEIDQPQRDRLVHQFRQDQIRVLVTTDVAARGIDLPTIQRVIHFDLPRSAEVYIHRSGRTGRNGAEGEVLLLVEAHDARLLGRIERYQQQTIPRRTCSGLEPKHREPQFQRKKKPKAPDKATKPKPPKKRLRDQKNKGKPKRPLGRSRKDNA